MASAQDPSPPPLGTSSSPPAQGTVALVQEEKEAAAPHPTSGGKRVWEGIKKAFDFCVEQWFIIGIGVVIVIARFAPNFLRSGGLVRAEYTIKYLAVAIIFFISGLSLPLAHLYKRCLDWKLHVVTHVTSFFIFPTFVFAIVNCVRAADPEYKTFNKFALVGMIVMGCLPTTVSSNVVMTGQAGGDQSASTIEVMLGNLVGTFLSPALLQMFLSTSDTWSFGSPKPSGSGGTGEIYRQVIEQLGFTVFIPLFVGEVIQYLIPVFVKKWRLKLKLAKVGSFCLLLVIWSTFSNAFYSGSFKAVSGNTIAFIVVVNILLYIFFSLFLFAIARLIPMPHFLRDSKYKNLSSDDNLSHWEEKKMFDVQTTIPLLFCGAAKGIVLGGPVVNILYGGLSPIDRGIVTIPLVLFQGSQVVAGQVTVAILKAWARRVKAKNERLLLEAEASPSGPSGESEGDEKRGSGDGSLSRSHPEAGRSGEVEEGDVTRTTTPVLEGSEKKAAV